MIRNFAAAWIALAIALLSYPALAQQTLAEEERCTEIANESGGSCVCNGTSQAGIFLDDDGSYSEPGLNYPCGSITWSNHVGNGGGNYAQVRGVAIPDPLPETTAQYAFEFEIVGSPTFHTGKQNNFANVPGTPARYCERIYHYLPEGFPTTVADGTSCQRIKLQEINNATAGNLRTQGTFAVGGGPFFMQARLRNTGGGTIAEGNFGHHSGSEGGQTYMSDYIGRWVRTETCISAGDYNSTSTTVTDIEFEIYAPADGVNPEKWERRTAAASGGTFAPLPASGVDLATRAESWLGNLYVESGAGAVCDGVSRYFAFSMAAAWETDEGQWIGAAYEMEGGGGSVPSPSGAAGFEVKGIKVH